VGRDKIDDGSANYLIGRQVTGRNFSGAEPMPGEPVSDKPPKGGSDQSPDALKQFDILIGQLRFEHTIMWTRIGFMMVAQAALLGFFASAVDKIEKVETWPGWVRLLVELAFPFVGFSLVVIFWQMKVATDWWTHRWYGLLEGREKAAFDDVDLFRNLPVEPPLRWWPQTIRPAAVEVMKVIPVVAWLHRVYLDRFRGWVSRQFGYTAKSRVVAAGSEPAKDDNPGPPASARKLGNGLFTLFAVVWLIVGIALVINCAQRPSAPAHLPRVVEERE
jgi:hypothetical protein